MKAVLLTLLCALSFAGFAQFDVQYSPDSAHTEPLNKDVEFFLKINNHESYRYPITWRITDNDFPSPLWEDYSCDSFCYTAETRTNTFWLEAGVSFTFIHHIGSRDVHGTGMSTISFFDPQDSAGTVQSLNFTLVSDTTVPPLGMQVIPTVAELRQNAPNPFSAYTIIEYRIHSGAGHLDIHDLTGKLVKRIIIEANQGRITVDDDLQTGLYFYSLWDGSERVDVKRMQVVE